MELLKVFHDRLGNTLTIWFGNPQSEYLCEETGDEVVLRMRQERLSALKN
jgi:hypothetical protein